MHVHNNENCVIFSKLRSLFFLLDSFFLSLYAQSLVLLFKHDAVSVDYEACFIISLAHYYIIMSLFGMVLGYTTVVLVLGVNLPTCAAHTCDQLHVLSETSKRTEQLEPLSNDVNSTLGGQV